MPATHPSPTLPPRQVWLATVGLVAALAFSVLALLALAQPHLSLQTNPENLLSTGLVKPLAALFVLAAAVSFAALKKQNLAAFSWYTTLAPTGLAAGLVLGITYENTQVLTGGTWGLSNLYQVSVFILAVTGTLALGFDRSHTPGKLLPFVTPLLAAGALFVAWLAKIGAATPLELVPALQNNILPLHVAANFMGYGCFAIAAAAAAALLLRARADAAGQPSSLPTVKSLEALSYRAVAVGFPFFSLAILLGCVWAYQAWGGYWSWDPKETWALIVWLLYAAYLHQRAGGHARPVVLAWWLLVGFAATLFCYLGVNMFLSGLHSYGSLAA